MLSFLYLVLPIEFPLILSLGRGHERVYVWRASISQKTSFVVLG